METADVVLRFLESVGKRSEAEFYLALFRATPKERFAAISVDANVARHASDAVVLDLRFLAALGLVPVVALGLFEPTDAGDHARRIRRRLEKSGVPTAELDPADAALAERAADAARAGVIPMVPFCDRATTLDGRFARMGELVTALHTRKLIFLHRPGGLRQSGALVPLVNLTTDFDALATSKELSRKERAILHEARRLVLERVPHKLLVAVTSPLNLFRELFTVKGAGTLLRRGAVIQRHPGWSSIDLGRLRALLTSSFGRAPDEAFFARPVGRVYLEEGYRGAAIVCDTPLGAYLSKFAVEREAQGEGIGRDLWELVTADHGALFWRSRRDNPIDAWYTQRCDGMARFAEWHVFWKSLAPASIAPAIEYALAQPADLPV
jgi:acetylglutamate kinase